MALEFLNANYEYLFEELLSAIEANKHIDKAKPNYSN